MKTKAIKTLALLLVLTLTMSVCGVTAMAVDGVTLNVNNSVKIDGTATDYCQEHFEKDLASASYAVLFDFDQTDTTAYTKPDDTHFKFTKTLIGTDSACEVKSEKYTGTISLMDNYEPNTTKKQHPVNASGDDFLLIFSGAEITLMLPEINGLKPVAVGYFANGYVTNKTYTTTLKATLESENPSDTMSFTPNDYETYKLAFCGFRAPTGDSLDKITIAVSGDTHMKLDDLCIIYEDATKIASDIRISADAAGNDGLYTIADTNTKDSLYATVPAARGEGKDIILAVYGTDGKLIKVATATEGSMQAAITNLTTVKGDDTITAVKAFVWNKDTLVPVGVNASIE